MGAAVPPIVPPPPPCPIVTSNSQPGVTFVIAVVTLPLPPWPPGPLARVTPLPPPPPIATILIAVAPAGTVYVPSAVNTSGLSPGSAEAGVGAMTVSVAAISARTNAITSCFAREPRAARPSANR